MISVIMSVYNEKLEWLQVAVESICKQTYKEFEFLIIIDNPNLPDALKDYLLQAQEDDSRIKIIYNEYNLGLAASLNRGLMYAKGAYIARMDADDISMPERFEHELKYLEEQELDLVATNKINIDEKGKIIAKDPYIIKNPNKSILYGNMIIHSSVLVKKDVMIAMKGYREFVNTEDFDLWIRMSEKGYKLGILNEYLLQYRLRSNSASIGRQLEQFYIQEYILYLSKERKKNGTDSFSIDNMKLFLQKKKITDKKKRKFSIANNYIQKALDEFRNRKYGMCGVHIVCAFVKYPKLVERIVSNFFLNKMYA